MPEEIKPKFEKSRPKCPFYGFHYHPDGMIDQAGNQCAAINRSYSPCQREFHHQDINWNECRLNTPKAQSYIEKMIGAGYRIFPQEFHPGDVASWEGISFRQWYDYIMKKEKTSA